MEISDSEEDTTESEDSDVQTSATNLRNKRIFHNRCLQPLAHYVGILMELCPTLEAIYKLRHQAGARQPQYQPISVTTAARPFVSNIRDKFPLATQDLINRLGEANWQRYGRLRTAEVTAPNTVAIEAPKSLFRPVSLFKDSALGSSLGPATEKAVSTASHSSFLSSNEGGDKFGLRVPKVPAGSDWGKPFLCPYCDKTVDIHARVAWK